MIDAFKTENSMCLGIYLTYLPAYLLCASTLVLMLSIKRSRANHSIDRCLELYLYCTNVGLMQARPDLFASSASINAGG